MYDSQNQYWLYREEPPDSYKNFKRMLDLPKKVKRGWGMFS